ncbi:response regulator [Roseovarius aestuarii]|nr:response regulator [Roseovarius aestuarii]
MDGTVLVADDDRTIRTVLTQALTRAGCKVHATSSLTTLMRWVDEGRGDAVITDVMMPDGNGLEMLPRIGQIRPGLPVIVISAQNTIMTAIQATEARAFDYLPKPFDLPDLMKRTARALDVGRRVQRTVDPAAAPAGRDDRPEELPLIGQAPSMQALYRILARLMNADLPVLITGESGTGKSLVARTLHSFSDRRALPLVFVGPGDLDDPAGPARIMEQAGGGTIVLDEINDLPAEAQGRLVRMMDATTKPAPRFIATSQSQQNLPGTLRDDLYYRLSGAVIDVPPLRARVEDIPLLATHVLNSAEQEDMPTRRILPDALDLLRTHSWPGNVRQLENTIRRIALTARTDEITRDEVAAVIGATSSANVVQAMPGKPEIPDERLADSVARHLQRYFDLHGDALPPAGLYARILREIEQPLIQIALDATGGNQAKCADLLGINRNTLRKKIGDLDIEVTRRRKLM